MPNILFICSANRFRSVIAEGYFNALLQAQKIPENWQVHSAGIWAKDGSPPLKDALDFAAMRGFEIESKRSQEINAQLVDDADLIIVMTNGQKEAIATEFSSAVDKIHLLSEICMGQYFDIPDPVLSEDEDPAEIAGEICNLIDIGFPRILAKAGISSPLKEVPIKSPEKAETVKIESPDVKKPRRRWWIWLLVVLILLACGYFLWTNPFFGRSLPEFSGEMIQTFTPLPAVQTALSETAVVSNAQSPGNQHGILQQPTKVKKSDAVCGETEPMIILALGIDEVEQADVIRLVRVDFVQKKILVLSIPRDFWVPIPGLEAQNITQFRINAAYGYGEYFDGPGQGVVKFSETVFYNYGINFDHYGAVHFAIFEQLIDAVGGVDFYLDGPIGAYGYKGYHHMDGKTALTFARERQYDSDAFRIKRQSVIIKAFLDKIRQPENLTKLPVLGAQVIKEKGVVTDFTLRDVYTFVCFIQELGEDSIVFKDIPLELYTPMITNYGRYIKVPKPDATVYIQDLVLNGNY